MMKRIENTFSPHGLMRLLITSYFIAMALGVIPGTALSTFLAPILPDPMALYVMHALVLLLSCAILFDVFRRPAALTLSLVLFYASYAAMLPGGDVSAFWRDLALIGALLMTADFGVSARLANGPAKSNENAPKTAKPGDATFIDSAFRKDFDIVRTS